MHDNMSKVYKKDKFHKNKVGKYKTANRRIKYHKSGGTVLPSKQHEPFLDKFYKIRDCMNKVYFQCKLSLFSSSQLSCTTWNDHTIKKKT